MDKQALLERVRLSNHGSICVNCRWFIREDCSCEYRAGSCIHFFGHSDNPQAKDFFEPTETDRIILLSKEYKPIPTFSKIWRS